MSCYLIDGFNLFHKIRAIADSPTPRRDLVNYIRRNNLTGSRNNRVTIVFDGFETAELSRDPEFEIVFSENRTADDIIKDLIAASRNKRDLIVVSDDREILARAHAEGATLCRTREFIAARPKKRKTRAQKSDDDRDLSPSTMMDITEELEKKWIR